MADREERRMVNLNLNASVVLEDALEIINAKRAEKNKCKLSRSDLIQLAIEKLNFSHGVKKWKTSQ